MYIKKNILLLLLKAKRLQSWLLENVGFEAVDLGTDVSVNKFIEAVKK